jgi:hypothetical protein
MVQIEDLPAGLDEAEVNVDNGLRQGALLGGLGVLRRSDRPGLIDRLVLNGRLVLGGRHVRTLGNRHVLKLSFIVSDGVESVEHREKSE